MREALARSDNDFVFSEPRSRRPARRAGIGGFFVACLRFAYHAAAYPNRVAAALLILVLVAIAVNALVLQRSPHPAPLFGRSVIIPSAPVQQQASPAPVPAAPVTAEKTDAIATVIANPDAPKPARDAIGQLLRGEAPHPMPPVSPRKHVEASPAASEAKPGHDTISQLLRTSPPSQSATESKPSTSEPNKTVLSAQRALVRLGFVLKADGVNGSATRQALEQFERDHNLPPKGELTPRVLRELATQSGERIE